ncbi:MAG: hypothetical protein IH797_06380, partial [Chloroflexi bacterium]|nr:hypothetical protein [Chloroflexota bacterium]
MNLSGLLSRIEGAPSLVRLREARARAAKSLTVGVADSAKAAVVALLASAGGGDGPLLVIVPREDRAEALIEELSAWLGAAAPLVPFPERDTLPYERLAPDPEAVRQRLLAASRLAQGERCLVVASAMALAQQTISPGELATAKRVLGRGDRLSPDEFLRELSALGYAIEPLVERPGQASRRGGIIDVFPPQAEAPVRIELVGREIESLRRFDPASQRSVEPVESMELGPAREAVFTPDGEMGDALARLDISNCTDEARGRFQEELSLLQRGAGFTADYFYVPFLAQATLLDHLPPDATLVIDEESDVATALEEAEREAEAVRGELELAELSLEMLPASALGLSALGGKLSGWAKLSGTLDRPEPSLELELAEATMDRFEALRRGEVGDRLALSSTEIVSVLRYSVPGLIPEGISEPRVEMADGVITLTARVPVEAFPQLVDLNAVLGVLPD